LLLLGTFDVYDLEETEYGNVAVALLDGHLGDYASLRTDPALGDALSSGAGRRRRTVWSIEPLVAPFFALLGPSMLSLKLFALTGAALWAALWFLVALRLAPGVPPWALGLLFVLPAPLIQRAALSATSITAHLGSSLWHAASLLAVLLALERARASSPSPTSPGRSSLALFLISGLLAGWGLHCSLSLAPLLVGVIVLLGIERQWVGSGLWALGTLPGLTIAWLFADPGRTGMGTDFVVASTGLSSGSASRAAEFSLADFGLALTHGPGFGRVDPGSLSLQYLPLGLVYSAVFVAACLWGWKVRERGGSLAERGTSAAAPGRLVLSLAVSFGAFVVAWAITGFRLDPTYFDGLRYLLPLSPLPPLLLLWLWGGHPKATRVVAGVGLLHAVGFAMLFRPAVFPAPWQHLKGYEPWVMKAWLGADLDEPSIHPDRRRRWALWAGISAAQRGEAGRTLAAGQSGLSAPSESAFWRGIGLGTALGASGTLPSVLAPDQLSPNRGALLWQGAGMARCYVGQRVRDILLEEVPPRHLGDLWYGFARADIYCGGIREIVPAPPPAVAGRIEEGLRDAWQLDYSGPGAPSYEDRPLGFVVY
jgi:hypothetical protein